MTLDYERRKEQAREKAIDIQNWIAEQNLSYGELAEIQDYLTELGKRFGLLTEFRENGLI